MQFSVSTILSGRLARLAGVGVLALAAFALSDAPAKAQDEDSGTEVTRLGLQLDVITVRARKFEENLQDTPVTLTAIDQNVIDDARLEDFQDFLFLVPGATFDQTRFNSNQTIVLRGVQGAPEELAEPGFGLYRDGAYYGGSRTNFGQFIDVESVEVLRGPQGGIFGRNAVGGAMNIRFNKPDPDGGFSGMVEGGYARYDEIDLKFVANVPIVEGKFAARAVAWYTDRSGGEYFNVTLDEKLDKREDKGGRLAFYFEPSDNFDVTFTAEAQSLEGPEGLQFFPEPSYFNPEGETKKTIRRDTLNRTESDFRYFSAEANWETDIGTFTLVGTFRKYDFESQGDQDFTDFVLSPGEVLGICGIPAGGMIPGSPATSTGPVPGFTPPPDNPAFPPAGCGFLQQIPLVDPVTGQVTLVPQEYPFAGTSKQELFFKDKTDYTFIELRWASKQDQRVRWIVGLNYFQEDRDFSRTVTFDWAKTFDLSSIPPTDTLFATLPIESDLKTDSFSVWGEFTVDITDRLEAIGSIRYTRDKKDFFLQRIAQAPGFIIPPGLSPMLPQGLPLNQILQQQIPDIAPQNVSETFEEVSPGGGLFYRASDTVNIYARVNTGFRAGGFNSVPLTTATLAYDEEKSINYELGLKTEWLDRRVRFNVALFLLEQDDLLLFIRDPNDVRFGLLDNLGKAETYGIEIDATAKLTENWDFMGAFAWMDAKCKQCNNGIIDASGNQIPGTADVTLSIVTTYRMALGNGLQLALNAAFRQRWGGYEDAANTIDLEDFSMLDLGIWLESDQGWYVNIYADNLFDEEYNINRVTTEGLVRLPAAQSRDRFEAFGFSYGAKVGYRF